MITITQLPRDYILDLTFRKFMKNKAILAELDEFIDCVLDDPSIMLKYIPAGHESETANFISNMTSRITTTKLEMKQNINLIIYDADAIAKIKAILVPTDNTDIIFVTAGKYQLCTTAATQDLCLEYLKTATDNIQSNILSTKCKLNIEEPIITKPRQFTLKPLYLGKT
jgi:translation initiation factor 2 alpha subunit (eIF-2alpha)